MAPSAIDDVPSRRDAWKSLPEPTVYPVKEAKFEKYVVENQYKMLKMKGYDLTKTIVFTYDDMPGRSSPSMLLSPTYLVPFGDPETNPDFNLLGLEWVIMPLSKFSAPVLM